MDKLERAYQLDKLLKQRRKPVSMQELCERFECSESTVKRTITEMRDLLNAPILNRERDGYFYSKNSTFEMPGVWFSAEELHALLAMQQLASGLSGGFLESEFHRLRERIETILNKSVPAAAGQMHRIRMIAAGKRSRELPLFPVIATALLERQPLHIAYEGRQRGEKSARDISPQRLAHYRGNWYLDAWCHEKGELRTFAVERISSAKATAGSCEALDEAVLERQLASSFGIFSGEPTATAVMRFTAKSAAWVADEAWFPDATGEWLEDGRFELCIPYNNPTELIMEICRHGPEVEVVSPPELRAQVAERLRQAVDQYAGEINI